MLSRTEPQPPDLPSASAVEQALGEVFARPELAPRPPSAIRLWIGERLDALREWLAGVLPRMELGGDGLAVLSWIVIGLLVVVAAGVVLHLSGLLGVWWRARERRGAGAGAGEASTPSPHSAASWEERAGRAAAAGRWRDAALALYQAMLLRLEGQGALRYDAAKTPGDYRRELKRDAHLAQLLESFLRGFEPVAFGARPLDGDGYLRLRDLAMRAGSGG